MLCKLIHSWSNLQTNHNYQPSKKVTSRTSIQEDAAVVRKEMSLRRTFCLQFAIVILVQQRIFVCSDECTCRCNKKEICDQINRLETADDVHYGQWKRWDVPLRYLDSLHRDFDHQTKLAEFEKKLEDVQSQAVTQRDSRPGYVELEHVNITVNEDSGTLQVNVIRIGGIDGILILKYKTLDVSAVAELDYVPVVGDLVFKDGESKKTINVFILNDDVRESLEAFQLQIFHITPGPGIMNFRPLGTNLITHITIIDDDARQGYVELEHVNITVKEDSGTLQVNVIRIGGTDGVLILKYKTLDVSAAALLDYVPVVGDLVFKDGESEKTINIFILNDEVIESLEAFQLQIFDITPGPGIINFRSLGTNLITHITIIDDDARPGYIEVENINITVLENVGTVLATLNRVEGDDGIITIQYRTVDGTARAQTDYVPVNGVLTFNGGERRKTIAVTIIDDTVWEHTEIFQLQFFNATVPSDVINFRQPSSRLNVIFTILDNDMKPGYIEMELLTITVLEKVRTVNVNLIRLGGTNGQIKIRYRTVDGTALVRSDYVPVIGEVVFNDGEDKKLIPISIIDDDIREPTENFQVLLFDPSAGPDVVNFRAQTNRLAANVVILDDDTRPGYLELEHVNVTVKEDSGILQVNVIRIGGTDGILNLKYKTLDVSAAAQLDYVPVVGDLVFQDDESKKTIDILIVNDDVRESLEAFQLQIFDITPGPGIINFRSLGTKLITHITIIDDDELFYEPCGTNRIEREANMPLVTGMTNATEGTWPWMAHIQKKRSAGGFGPWCTGFLIDKKHAVSVAYSFKEKETDLYRVIIRSVDEEAGEECTITRIVVPEVFVRVSLHDDIAILTLSRDVDIPNFVPVCLPDNRIINTDLTGKGTTLAGWARYGRHLDIRFLKQLSGIHVKSNEECETPIREITIWYPRGLTSDIFCARSERSSEGACSFDYGSLLMLLDRNRWYAVGITSYPHSCEYSNSSDIYTRVTSYLDWIKENIRD